MIFPVASHSRVQEEYHSKVQDPHLQMPGSGIEKYGTKVQEDHSDQLCRLFLPIQPIVLIIGTDYAYVRCIGTALVSSFRFVEQVSLF